MGEKKKAFRKKSSKLLQRNEENLERERNN